MKSGFQALGKAIETSNASRGGMAGYIGWKDGERKVIRFVTDEIYTVSVYNFVTCKDGKSRGFLIDPEQPDYLAKYSQGLLGKTRNPATGLYETPKAREMSVNLAVLREERVGADGRMEVVDVIQDVEVNGGVQRGRVFGIVQQALGNFWTQLFSCYRRYGTTCDRDYEITRTGGTINTSYAIIPCESIPSLQTPEAVAAAYGYGRDNTDPMMCPTTTGGWCKSQASEDRYRYWLTPDADTPPTLLGQSPSATHAPSPAVSTVLPSRDPWGPAPDAPGIPPHDASETPSYALKVSQQQFDAMREELMAQYKQQ